MRPFNTKLGAGVLVGLAAVYMVASLATGRQARAERAPDLTAREAGLDAYRAAALVVRDAANVAVVDVRPRERFELYHVPGAVSAPGAGKSQLVEAAHGRTTLLIIAETDKDAEAVVSAAAGSGTLHYLKDGARAWYVAFELPVALFNDKPAPYGYQEALAQARACFSGPCADTQRAVDAVGVLSKSGYEPIGLGARKPAAGGGAKKKIAGGCGG